MSKKKIYVVGAFGYLTNQLDGQTIKTRNIYQLLQDRFDSSVLYFDTLAVRKRPFDLFKLLFELIKCNTLILVPCKGNLTYLFPVAYLLSKIFNYKIVIICIGGWQYEYFMGLGKYRPHKLQMNLCRKIRAHLPEMKIVHDELVEHCSFTNSEVFPNFRFIQQRPITENTGALKLVFMARIRKDKGFPQIFKALDILKSNHMDVTMDFYGQINPSDKSEFLNLLESHKENTRYCGPLTPSNIIETLREYDVMLLPTRNYAGEGFPGTILDSFIAGLAVIATEWKYSHEFIEDGKVGYIIPFDDCVQPLAEKIAYLDTHRDILLDFKRNSLNEAKKYDDNAAWEVLSKYL